MGQAKNRKSEIENLKLTGPRAKALGQIYTPTALVNEMLDKLPTWSENIETLKWKTILEPACGNGQFVVEIIARLMKIYEEKKAFKDNSQAFIHIMQNQLFAVEFDSEVYEECVTRVKAIGQTYGCDEFNHNIICADTLKIDFGSVFLNNMQNWKVPFLICEDWQMTGAIKFKLPSMYIESCANPSFKPSF